VGIEHLRLAKKLPSYQLTLSKHHHSAKANMVIMWIKDCAACAATLDSDRFVSSSGDKGRLLVRHAVLRKSLHLRKMRIDNIRRTRSGAKDNLKARTRRNDEGG
jgi:hypothetical protein